MTAAVPSRNFYGLVYLGLVALLALTAAAARLPGGSWSLPLALGIATAKLGLIYVFFMQLGVHRGLVRVAALAGFCWLGLLLTLAFADYLNRGGN